MQRLTPVELHALLAAADPAPLLLDVREEWEFAHSRIDGSVNVPLGRLPEAAPRLTRAAPVVVICHHGIRSAHAAHYLEQIGFTEVSNLEGGIDAWARQVDPEVPLY